MSEIETLLAYRSAPWWAFLLMPVMMLGMPLMMWIMMRTMMGHGGVAHGTPSASGPPDEESTDSELIALRRQVADLEERLAAMEVAPLEPQRINPTVDDSESEPGKARMS